jgi:hypothetical protein
VTSLIHEDYLQQQKKPTKHMNITYNKKKKEKKGSKSKQRKRQKQEQSKKIKPSN